jgi:photosystem II stability/assembly factor-like uncharacterized protein
MTIEDRLRASLRSSAGESAEDWPPLEDLWRRIERGVGGQRRRVGVRVATAVFALVLAAGAFVWLVLAFSGSGGSHHAIPAAKLSVANVRVYGVRDVAKIYGVVTNPTGAAVGATITCTVRDAAGHGLTTVPTSVSYIAPGASQQFVTQASFTGTAASAACRAASIPAVSPPPIAVATRVFTPAGVAFWDAKRGLVAGLFGPADHSSGTSRIEVTADGGRTWRVALGSRTSISDVQTLGTDLAWAVTGPCAMGTCDRALLASTDGGVTWTRIFTGPLERVSFVSSTDGWAVGHLFPAGSQQLEATSDGGHTWRDLPVPCPREAGIATDLSFVTPTHGWLLCTGEGGAGEEGKAVLETGDGGRTWQMKAEIAPPPKRSIGTGLTITGYPTGVVFLPNAYGWMWLERGDVLETHDGGQNWRELGLSEFDVTEVTSMWFSTDGTGFALRYGAGTTELLSRSQEGKWTTVRTWGP